MIGAKYLIYELGQSDIDELIELEKKCFAYHWTREQFELGLDRKAYKTLGIRHQGKLVGYIAFSLIQDEMEILNLAIHPDWRRCGGGEALLEAAFSVCRDLGIAKSFLDVKQSNRAAIGLYSKFGYVQIGVRKRYYPDTKEDALLFRYDFK